MGTPQPHLGNEQRGDTARGVSEDSVAALSTRLDELTDLFRRRLLDDKEKKRAFDALYDRLERAERELEAEAILPLVRDLLLLVDRLDAHDDGDPFVVSIAAELLESLRRSGVEPIAMLDRFDPGRHEVVEVIHDAEDGAVVRQVRRGWMIGDRLLRPAHVVVGGGFSSAHPDPINR